MFLITDRDRVQIPDEYSNGQTDLFAVLLPAKGSSVLQQHKANTRDCHCVFASQ